MEHDFSKPVAKLDDVPADFRPLYVEKDGAYVVNESFGPVTGAIIGLGKSLKSARTDAENAKKGLVDLSPLSEFGPDVPTIAAAIKTRVEELTTKGGDATKAIERIRGELSTAHTTALQGEQKKSEALRGQLYTHLVTSEATGAISEAKGVVPLLLPFLEKQIRVAEVDGKFVPQVIDGDGAQRYSPTTGQPMTIKELVTSMKADAQYARLFDSDSQAGGTGTRPGTTTRAAPTQKGELSSHQKIAAGLKSLMPQGH